MSGHNSTVRGAFVGAEAPHFSSNFPLILFQGGPGATGRSFSNFATLLDAIRYQLFTLPPDTVVHTGHGESTSIGTEVPRLDDWIARGH